LYPYVRVSFEEWQREKSENWKSLKFFNTGVGVGLEKGPGYLKTEITKPFSAKAGEERPSGRYGFSAESGIKLKSFSIGLFYKYGGFENPDAKMTQTGIIMGYIF